MEPADTKPAMTAIKATVMAARVVASRLVAAMATSELAWKIAMIATLLTMTRAPTRAALRLAAMGFGGRI